MPQRRLGEKLNKLLHFEFQIPAGESESMDLSLSADEVMDQLDGEKSSSLFLGHYTEKQVADAMEATDILPRLRKKGFTDLIFRIGAKDRFEHQLLIYYDREDREHLLGQILIKEGVFRPKTRFVSEIPLERLEMLFIGWILMQDPLGIFTPERQRLPGQTYPGLGVGHQVVDLILRACKRLEKDGVLNFPEFYHNAFFYSELFFFYNPGKQGEIMALWRDLGHLGIVRLSFAVYFECVRDLARDHGYEWLPEEQVLPVRGVILDYFDSREYWDAARESFERCRFGIDEKKLEACMRERAGEV